MKKLLLCALLLLSMLVTLVVPAYAELDEPIMLDDCDTSTWHGSGGKDFLRSQCSCYLSENG